MKKIDKPASIAFNQYVRRNEDKTLTVWFLPGMQADNTVVYGGEFIYTFDSTGNILLQKNEYYQGKFHSFKTGKTKDIYLDYKDLEQPTTGAIFFAWYYKKYFSQIYIETSLGRSTLMFNGKEYNWVHADYSK